MTTRIIAYWITCAALVLIAGTGSTRRRTVNQIHQGMIGLSDAQFSRLILDEPEPGTIQEIAAEPSAWETSAGTSNVIESTGIQTPAKQEQAKTSPPILRSTTRLVQVSVVVHDKKGDPIADLTKDDFAVFDDKKPQAIQVFSVYTNLPKDRAPTPLPPNTYSNRAEDLGPVPTSVTVILLDGLNTKISDQAWAKKKLSTFLEQIQPQDRVALYSLGRRLRVLHEFTNDATSLLAALNSTHAESDAELAASTPEVSDTGVATLDAFINDAFEREANLSLEDRVYRTVDALVQISNHIGNLPGRKNLLWVTGSFPFSVGADDLSGPQPDEPILFEDEVVKAVRALTNANVAIYPVDARGLMATEMGLADNLPNPTGKLGHQNTMNPRSGFEPPNPENFQTMLTMADRTGGLAFFNTNDINGAIRQAVEDSRVTYELAYAPEEIQWDGKFHEIKVEVKRPGAHVRARKGYFALPEPTEADAQESREQMVSAIVESSINVAGIGMRTQVVAMDNTPGARKIKIVTYFDLHDFQFEERNGVWYGTVNAIFALMNGEEQKYDAIDQTFHLHMDPATYQRQLREGTTYTKEIPLKDTTTALKVILRDATNGNMGDVYIPLAKYFPTK